MSSSLRKLLICPYFGELPEWFELWHSNIMRLADDGYTLLMDMEEEAFADRVERLLGVAWPRGDGRKVCDYRCAFGLLYPDEIGDFDFWGHTDLDCVYGRVDHFLPDVLLGTLDIFSNHPTYMSGPWSLYRNTPKINQLFQMQEDWQGYLENPETTGWVETAYSRLVDDAHSLGLLTKLYANYQTKNLDSFSRVHFDGDRLMEGVNEIMVAHFRRTKVYPGRCR